MKKKTDRPALKRRYELYLKKTKDLQDKLKETTKVEYNKKIVYDTLKKYEKIQKDILILLGKTSINIAKKTKDVFKILEN